MNPATVALLLLGVIGTALLVASAVKRRRSAQLRTWQPRITDDQKLAAALQQIIGEFRQPALAAALVIGNRIIAQGAVGVRMLGERDAVAMDSRFHIGSTTKTMTTLLLAQAVAEGRLRYETTLAEALPHIPLRAEYRAVTLRDLVLHRAGVVPFQVTEKEDPALVQNLWYDLPLRETDPARQRREVAAIVLNRPPVAIPGTRSIYSNIGYALLGHVLEQISGASYETLLHQRIFEPLGMEHSRSGGWPASGDDPQQPRGHFVDRQASGGLRPQELEDAYVFPAWLNPAGGVHCSICDFARYVREHLRGLQGAGVLLNREGYQAMHRPQASVRMADMYAPAREELAASYGRRLDRTKLSIGYGWAVAPFQGARLSAADGSGGTFFARLAVIPEINAAFAGFSNTGDGARALDAAIARMTGLRWASG